MTASTERKKNSVELVFEDGSRFWSEYDMTYFSDVRETAFGPVDFGRVYAGPSQGYLEKPDGSVEKTSLFEAMMCCSMAKP